METTRHIITISPLTAHRYFYRFYTFDHRGIKNKKFSLHFIAALNKWTGLDGKGRAINGRKAGEPVYVYSLQFTVNSLRS